MAIIKNIQDKRGNILHPITEEDAVIDAGGARLSEKLTDLESIRSGANLGATAYQKPSTGIPTTDLESATQAILASVVLYGETVETVND